MSIDTSANLSGFFKERYADNLIDLIPETAILTKLVKFDSAKKVGNLYHQPVVLQNEQGVTYSLGVGVNDGFSLNQPVPMAMQDAQIQGSAVLLRSQIGYGAIEASQSDQASFGRTLDMVMKNMYESMTARIEIGLLYGGTGLGVITSGVATSGTVETVTITGPTWSTGIWGSIQGATVQVYYGTGADKGAGTLVSSGADSIFTVGALTLPTSPTSGGTVALTGTSTGCTALNTAIGAQSNINIYFNGANAVEAVGISSILNNTGTQFNIPSNTYNLWQSNVLSITGSLSMKQLQYAVGIATSRGLNEPVKVFVSPNTWTNLLTNETALRRYDGSFSTKELENGSESICFYSQNGVVEVVSHIYCKDGDCFIVPTKRLKRIGSTDVTNTMPGTSPDEIFINRPDNAAYELRLYSNQALLLETPARAVYVSGFVNTQ